MSGTSYDTYEKLCDAEEVEASTAIRRLGYEVTEGIQNANKPYIYLVELDSKSESMMPIHLTEGRMPAVKDEILLPDFLVTWEGVYYDVGDKISLAVGERIVDGKSVGQETK